MMLRIGLLTTAFALVAVTAAAQTGVIERMVTPGMAASSDQRGDQVRVNVSISLYFPGPAGDSEAALSAQERARRMVYDWAARECVILRQAIASDCRLESINVNVNRHPGQQPEGFQAGGNFAYRITLR